jgi:hypothetical protein
VTGEPAPLGGVFHVTEIFPDPRCAVTDSGGSGTVAGTTTFEVSDGTLTPARFAAVTVTV